MKVILTSIGTRGDMEPFLAIGEILKQRGHDVICLFPEQFRSLAEDSGLGFASLGSEFLEMIDSKDGKAALGGSGSFIHKVIAVIRLARHFKRINKNMVNRQYEVIETEKPDRLIHNAKVMYAIVWGLNNRQKNILISPVPYLHYVKNHSHLAFNSNLGSFFNKLTFSIARWGLLNAIITSIKWLGIKRVSRKTLRNALMTNKTIYTISPSLFSRPVYWADTLKVLGYHERNKQIHWTPSEALESFLNRHKKILLVTFGSMTNPTPEKKTQIILEIMIRNKIPTLIITAAGGLVKPANFNNNLIFFESQIPYDWLLPKIYAVIHHGGSGTTHMVLKHGCSSMIIPHIIDQFVWSKMIYEQGAGPSGVRIDRLSMNRLEPKILDLLNNASYKRNAERIGKQMEQEDFTEELYKAIVELT